MPSAYELRKTAVRCSTLIGAELRIDFGEYIHRYLGVEGRHVIGR